MMAALPRSLAAAPVAPRAAPPAELRLPAHVDLEVCRACALVAQRIAANGLPKRQPHRGFSVIVAEPLALDTCGATSFNKFKDHDLRLLGADGGLNEKTFDILRRNAFHAGGALVVDSRTSKVVASGWVPSLHGSERRPARLDGRAARLVAQQAGGCLVITCAEDSRGALAAYLPCAERLIPEGFDVAAAALR